MDHVSDLSTASQNDLWEMGKSKFTVAKAGRGYLTIKLSFLCFSYLWSQSAMNACFLKLCFVVTVNSFMTCYFLSCLA